MKKMKSGGVKTGFTLIEVLVVSTIIVLLGIFVVSGLQRSRGNLALQRGSHQLAQELRKAQEWAMSARDTSGPLGNKVIPLGGYGICLDPDDSTQYVFFADCDGNGILNEGGTPCDELSPNAFGEAIQTLELEAGVTIGSLSSGFSKLYIVFEPPDPKVHINPAASLASITLSNGTEIKIVTVNSVGLVSVQ